MNASSSKIFGVVAGLAAIITAGCMHRREGTTALSESVNIADEFLEFTPLQDPVVILVKGQNRVPGRCELSVMENDEGEQWSCKFSDDRTAEVFAFAARNAEAELNTAFACNRVSTANGGTFACSEAASSERRIMLTLSPSPKASLTVGQTTADALCNVSDTRDGEAWSCDFGDGRKAEVKAADSTTATLKVMMPCERVSTVNGGTFVCRNA